MKPLPAVIAAAAMLSMALLAMLSSAGILLIAPEETALPGHEVLFKFNATEQANNCSILINGASSRTVQAGQNQITSASMELQDGAYNWSISCATNSTTISSQTRQITVDTTPPEVRLLTPSRTFNTSMVALDYHAADATLRNCTLSIDIDGSMKDVKTSLFPLQGQSNSFTIELPDRQYKWNVRCADRAGNANMPLFTAGFSIDTTPPAITLLQPLSVVTGTSATLSLTTSEEAECRHSQSSQNYNSMIPFSVTSEKQHQQPLTFQGDGVFPYHAVCKDRAGNQNPPRRVDVNVYMLPTANITLSDPSPLKAGIVEATVVTSKNMSSAPTLTYTASGKETAIALTGQGDTWKGSFLIESLAESKIATFAFRGADIAGYTGTAITEGKTFIIDTAKPAVPINLKAEGKGGAIAVRWHQSNDEPVQYKVYRSNNPAPTYLDIYNTANSTTFIDVDVEDKVTYYYRVAAIDEAGNLGELSEAVYSTARPASGSTAETAPPKKAVLPPNLVIEVNDAAKKIESVKITVEGAIATLNALSGKAKEIAEAIGAKGAADSANKRLEQLLAQLESLKSEYKEQGELREILKKATDESSQIEKETAKDIAIESRVEDLPIVKREQMLKALEAAFSETGAGAGAKERYMESNEKDLQDLRIKTEAEVARISRANGEIEEKTLVTHSFTYAGIEPAKESIVIVFIPKSIAQSSKELSYPGGKPEVLQDDPVLKWGFLSVGPEEQKISYIAGKKLSDEEVRKIEIVPLLGINRMAEDGSTPTGLAIYDGIKGTSQLWIILPGLLIVIALGGYYALTSQRSRPKEDQEAEPEQTPMLKELDDRLSTIQVEIDEEIYPILKSIRNSIRKNDEVSGAQLLDTLIGTARNSLDQEKPDRAKELYLAIQLLYQSLPQEQKSKFSTDCLWLYRQLNRKG